MTEHELNELSIFALRELARKVGVGSPTSKKKDALVQGIIDIIDGREKPYVAKTKQGRPPKNNGYHFAEVVLKGKSASTEEEESDNTLRQDIDFTMGVPDTINGYVEIVNNNTANLCVVGDCSVQRVNIPIVLVYELGLKAGDFIHARLESNGGVVNVVEVLNINNCPLKKYNKERKTYEQYKHTFSNDNLEFQEDEFNEFNIKLGESVYLYGANNNDNTEAIIRLLNACIADKKIYVNTAIADKNHILIEAIKDAELFTAKFTDGLEVARGVVSLATERAKRLLERGENVVVAIDDVLSVAGIDSQDLPITKSLVSLTKATEDAGAISVFAIISADRGISLFEKLADKRVKVVEHKLFIMD